jgi:hypothetical protein
MRVKVIVCAVTLVAAFNASTARAQEPDPAFKADIEKLLEVTGAARVGAQIANTISAQMIDAMQKAQPNIPPRAAEIIKDVLSTEFAAAFDSPGGLHGTIITMYAKHFTHDEIKGLLAFYATDLGKKAAGEMSSLAQEGAAAGQAWAVANLPRISGVLESRLRAEKLIP